MATHQGKYSDPACPVCGPLIAAAKAANAEWTRQQQHALRHTKAYKDAISEARTASRELVAAKRSHYSTTDAGV